jgi:hypothetical protein
MQGALALNSFLLIPVKRAILIRKPSRHALHILPQTKKTDCDISQIIT